MAVPNPAGSVLTLGGYLDPMHVAIHDADKTQFPNLALMKLSAWHKAQGDQVSWFNPVGWAAGYYDRIYSSRVFTYSPPEICLPPEAVRGGSGYGASLNLPDEVEHMCPDYGLYPNGTPFGVGFTTRGCARKCPWCIVPQKEGAIRPHAEIEEFLHPTSDRLVLLDNNAVAHEHSIRQLEKAKKLNLRLDVNGGLDARIVAQDEPLAAFLASIRWDLFVRLACDTDSQMIPVEKAVRLLRKHGCHKKMLVYVLAKDVAGAMDRVEFLRGLKVQPFVQPYRNPLGGADDVPDPEVRHFARWVNRKEIFTTVKWEDYCYNPNNPNRRKPRGPRR